MTVRKTLRWNAAPATCFDIGVALYEKRRARIRHIAVLTALAEHHYQLALPLSVFARAKIRVIRSDIGSSLCCSKILATIGSHDGDVAFLDER